MFVVCQYQNMYSKSVQLPIFILVMDCLFRLFFTLYSVIVKFTVIHLIY